MRFLLLPASLVAGVLVAWLSILGAVWYIAPIFLVLAGVVATGLDNASRLRIAAFSLGMIAVFAVEANSLLREVNQHQQRAKERIRTEPAPTSRPPTGLFS